jgi:hypothetical protein
MSVRFAHWYASTVVDVVEERNSLSYSCSTIVDRELAKELRVLSKRVMVLLATAAMAVAMLAVAGVASAQVASPTLSPIPDETWQTNGKVYSIVRHGDYVYVGGKFTRVVSPTGESFGATNLARFFADTGVGDKSWTPKVTGPDMTKVNVYALAAAGENIWVGGKFEAVDNVARRNLAAVSADTGAVDSNVDSLVGTATASGVRAMIASSTKVYIGGGFGKVEDNGASKTRKNLAAFDFSGELDQAWRPKTDKQVRTLAFSCDGATVFAGGKIRNAASPDGSFSPRSSIARFDAITGELDPWAVPAGIVQNDEEVASDLAVTCERVTTGYLGPNFTRSYRLDDGDTGTLAWEVKSAGDVQTATMLGTDKLVIGGHFGQYDGQKRTKIALINLSDGSVDDSWKPEVDGSYWGPWDLLVDESHLYVGGAFKTVDDLPRKNFTRFPFITP